MEKIGVMGRVHAKFEYCFEGFRERMTRTWSCLDQDILESYSVFVFTNIDTPSSRISIYICKFLLD